MTMYDVVVLGASGFTGQYIVEELFLKNRDKNLNLKIAVAGRNITRIKETLNNINERINDSRVKELPVLLANVMDSESLNEMCRLTKSVLNCVGPYRFYGEPVVQACVQNKVDYYDITGEPEFIEEMYLKYHQAAKDGGCLVVSTCGFDSIPADVGTEFCIKQFPDRSLVSSVESFLYVASEKGLKAHYATWESAVHGFANQANLRKVRKETNEYFRQHNLCVNVPITGSKLVPQNNPTWCPYVQKWALPFPGSDASVVKRSQKHIFQNSKENPVQFNAYFCVGSTFWLSIVVLVGTFFKLLSSFSFGRTLLLKYPNFFSCGVFSHEGPSQADLAATSFDMTFVGRAYSSKELIQSKSAPDVTIITRFAGPEPGYVATPKLIVWTFLTVNKNKNLTKECGVLSPAVVLRNTDFCDQLNSDGFDISVCKTKND